MLKKEIREDELLDLILTSIREKGQLMEDRSGTYNKADPTHYHRWMAKLWLEEDYSHPITLEDVTSPWEELSVEDTNFPLYDDAMRLRWTHDLDLTEYHVYVHDVTWGIDFEIRRVTAAVQYAKRKVETAYWSREGNEEGGKWVRVTPRFFNLLTEIASYGQNYPTQEEIYYHSEARGM